MSSAHRIALVDVRRDLQRQADVLALDRLERIGDAGRARRWCRRSSRRALVVYWPVRNGTSWPTLITASWLSSVMTDGVDRMLFLPSLRSAVTSAPSWKSRVAGRS